MFYSEALEKLIGELMKLPTIGPKTAQKLAFHIIKAPKEDAEKLIKAIKDVKEKIKECPKCHNITDREICYVCQDPHRDKTKICVVAKPEDIPPIEKSRAYNGLYHVLGGVLSPLDGIGPDDINIKSLIKRIKEENIKEVIIATDSDTSGDITAMYISKILKPMGVQTSRLAHGLPVGASLEYADEITLSRAFEGRRSI